MKVRRGFLVGLVYLAIGVAMTLLDFRARRMPIATDTVYWTVYRCGLWLSIAPIALWFTRRWDRGFNIARALALIAAVLSCAFLAEVLYFASINEVYRIVYPRARPFDVIHEAMLSMTFPTIFILSITLTVTGFRVAAAEYEQQRSVFDYERRLSEARLSVLQSQLQPHFLFNSLNSLAALVRLDPHAAKGMLARLEAYYFASAKTAERRSHSLAEELDSIQQYIEIERIRFGDRLRVESHIEPSALEIAVPPFILQPLVENAIRHGVACERGPGFLTIDVRRTGEEIRLEIRNNSRAATASREGVGLRNTSERLTGAYGGGAAFSLHFDGTTAHAELIVTGS